MADTLTPDELAILSALKDGPLDMGHIGRVILGEPPRDGRTRVHKAWVRRMLDLFCAHTDLLAAGVIRAVEPVAPGEMWRAEVAPSP